LGCSFELRGRDLAIAVSVVACEQGVGFAYKLFPADASVSVVVEIGELCFFENGSCLLDRLEFRNIDVTIMIAVGQIEDPPGELLPLIASINPVVVQIPYLSR